MVVPILSTAELILALRQFKKGIRSKNKRKPTSKAFDTQSRGGPRRSTPIPEPGVGLREVCFGKSQEVWLLLVMT